MLPEGDLPGVWGTFVLMVVVLTRGCVFGGIHKFALRTSPFTIHKRCFKEPKANEGRKGGGGKKWEIWGNWSLGRAQSVLDRWCGTCPAYVQRSWAFLEHSLGLGESHWGGPVC
jgi:hypothetical protein